MRTLLLLLFGCCSAFGQAWSWNDPAFTGQRTAVAGGGSFTNPTNLVGYACTLFCAPFAYATNGGVPTLKDYIAGNDLTNRAAASTWPTGLPADQNGQMALQFNAAQYLNSLSFQSGSQPFELVAVLDWTATTLDISAWWDSGTGSEVLFDCNDPLTRIFSGAVVSTGTVAGYTNRYSVFDIGYSGSVAFFYSNNVAVVTGANSGANVMNGIRFGLYNNNTGFGAKGKALAVMAFGNGPIPGTNAAARTSNYQWLTNTFNLPPP